MVLLVSCQHTSQTENVLIDIAAMPPEPKWVVFTEAPIKSKTDNIYTVTSEFVERSLQDHKHLERIKVWKKENQVP